jgi:diguanylate cyclase (GGDEF)-like protein/PAS domain S-box-containing protein
LALVISAVLFLLMLPVGLWLDRQFTAAMRYEEVRQAKLHGSTLLASLQTLMLNGQGTLARSWLDRMYGESGITDIAVLRRDGKEAFTDLNTVEAVNNFLGYPRFERQAAVSRQPGRVNSSAFERSLRGELSIDWNTPGEMTLLMPIARQSECLACHGYEDNPLRGVLKLSFSTRDEERRIDNVRYRLWGIAAALVGLLGVAMWLALRMTVLWPIARLRDAITRVGRGDRHAKLAVRQRDELGEVVTVFNQMQDQLLAGETRIRAVMDHVADAVITIDEKGIIESANQAVRHVFGYSPGELLGQNVKVLMPPPYHDEHDKYINNYLASGKPRILGMSREIVGRRKDGSVFPMDLTVSEMSLRGRRHFIGIARDITERMGKVAAIEYQALHDALTDLPNRTLFSDRLLQAILSATREGKALAVMIMDLDHFKEINDTFGHHGGDVILQQVAGRMRSVLRKSDTVARLGGDEFAVLLPSSDLADALMIAKKLLGALDRPCELETQLLQVGASLGIALFPEHGPDGATLMKRADEAMYEAKRGKMGFAVYDSAKDHR